MNNTVFLNTGQLTLHTMIDWLEIFYKPSPPWAVISGRAYHKVWYLDNTFLPWDIKTVLYLSRGQNLRYIACYIGSQRRKFFHNLFIMENPVWSTVMAVNVRRKNFSSCLSIGLTTRSPVNWCHAGKKRTSNAVKKLRCIPLGKLKSANTRPMCVFCRWLERRMSRTLVCFL